MSKRHSYRNDQIPAGTMVDLAGDTVNYPHGGELRLGSHAGFLDSATGHQSINTDGTLTAYPVEDELIGSYIACEICGLIVDSERKLIKCGGRFRCKDCARDCS